MVPPVHPPPALGGGPPPSSHYVLQGCLCDARWSGRPPPPSGPKQRKKHTKGLPAGNRKKKWPLQYAVHGWKNKKRRAKTAREIAATATARASRLFPPPGSSDHRPADASVGCSAGGASEARGVRISPCGKVVGRSADRYPCGMLWRCISLWHRQARTCPLTQCQRE